MPFCQQKTLPLEFFGNFFRYPHHRYLYPIRKFVTIGSMEGLPMNRLDTALQHICQLLNQKNRVIVAIDGNCTAGKTTLASQLMERLECNVFHMDDFFLRPEQRTPQRFEEVGGNVDYERFKEELLLPLLSGEAFSYRPFDCSTFTLSAPVTVQPKKLTIIEGSYCLHPYFEDPYDLKILLTVDPGTQRQRVMERPEFLQERFLTLWIPMENRYFETLSIGEKADLIL